MRKKVFCILFATLLVFIPINAEAQKHVEMITGDNVKVRCALNIDKKLFGTDSAIATTKVIEYKDENQYLAENRIAVRIETWTSAKCMYEYQYKKGKNSVTAKSTPVKGVDHFASRHSIDNVTNTKEIHYLVLYGTR